MVIIYDNNKGRFIIRGGGGIRGYLEKRKGEIGLKVGEGEKEGWLLRFVAIYLSRAYYNLLWKIWVSMSYSILCFSIYK